MIKTGDIIKGIVSGIEEYGFFIKTKDGYNGLIHISEVSDNFVKNIYDYVTLGEEINVKVLEVDNKNKKMKLSIKNIEYRICNKLPDDGINGFASLKEKLPEWIEEVKEEMKKTTN